MFSAWWQRNFFLTSTDPPGGHAQSNTLKADVQPTLTHFVHSQPCFNWLWPLKSAVVRKLLVSIDNGRQILKPSCSHDANFKTERFIIALALSTRSAACRLRLALMDRSAMCRQHGNSKNWSHAANFFLSFHQTGSPACQEEKVCYVAKIYLDRLSQRSLEGEKKTSNGKALSV